jgi:hypothetical protein
MGSIQNKRASARQAPPDVYIGFMPADKDTDWSEVKGFFVGLFIIIAVVIMAGLALLVFDWTHGK